MERRREFKPCACPTCATPEERARLREIEEREQRVNRLAFEAYWEDRMNGRLRTIAYYVEYAWQIEAARVEAVPA